MVSRRLKGAAAAARKPAGAFSAVGWRQGGGEALSRAFGRSRWGPSSSPRQRQSSTSSGPKAVAAFRKGEQWWLTDRVERLAAEEQKGRLELDPWFDLITEYVMTRVSGTWFTPAEILKELGVDKSRRERAHEMRVGNVLRELGCERRRERRGAGGGNTSIVDRGEFGHRGGFDVIAKSAKRPVPIVPTLSTSDSRKINGRCSTNNAAGGAEWGQWGQGRKKRRPGCDPTARDCNMGDSSNVGAEC